MSKNIWIINDYAGTPYHGMEFRHYYLAKELIKLDCKVTIISSSYSHLFKNQPTHKREMIEGIEYLWLKTFNYGDAHNKKRVLKWFWFMFKLLSLPFRTKKPDVIIVSSIAPFSILPAWILSKFYRAKLIFEVKDIWPLSLVEVGGFKSTHLFIKFMGWFEKFALKKSDFIVSNLENYGEHIKNLNIEREFSWISNGIDLDSVRDTKLLNKEIADKIPKDKFIVGYTGSIGIANALDSFLESATLLKEKKEIVFVIVGKGNERERLKKEFESENIIFIDAIDKNQVPSMLELFDICFLGWNKESLYRYGTSANKIFDYMLSAKPIINAFSGAGDIIQKAQCGITVEANNETEIKEAILKLYSMSEEERNILGKNAKEYVLKYFTYKELAKKYRELF